MVGVVAGVACVAPPSAWLGQRCGMAMAQELPDQPAGHPDREAGSTPAAEQRAAGLESSTSVGEARGSSTEERMPRSVRVLVDPCDPPIPFLLELPEQLRIELSGVELSVQSGAPAPAGVDSHAAEITFSVTDCAPNPDIVDVRVVALSTARRTTRRISLEAEDTARPLALAVAELLPQVWPQLSRVDPERLVEPAQPPPPSLSSEEARAIAHQVTAEMLAAEPAPTRRPRRWHLGTVVGARLTPEVASGALAIRLLLQGPARGLLRGFVDLGTYVGGARDQLGDIDIRAVAVGGGIGLVRQLEDLRIGIGPRLELGYSWLRGKPSAPAVDDGVAGLTQGGATITLGVEGHVQLRLRNRFWIGLSAEAGWVLLGLNGLAFDRTATGIAGPLVNAALSLAVEMGK